MANNWAKWDELRAKRPELGGQHTSKEGLAVLEKKGIRLEPSHSYSGHKSSDPVNVTRVLHNNRMIGTVRHRTGMKSDRFGPYAVDVRKIDQFGPIKESAPLTERTTHDAAIDAVLREHGLPVPSTVVGPRTNSVVSRAYTGRRAAPTTDMSAAKRAADSIATRIRMNSARTDPLTGNKLTSSTSSAAKLAARINKPVTTNRLKTLYGKMLVVHRKKSGPSPTIDRHTTALTLSPEHHHRLVSMHMAGSPTGGIHVGDKPIVEMKGSYVHQAELEGHQLVADRTNAQLGGVYNWVHRQMVVPEDKGLSGSHSTASHEFGHALDRAYGTRLAGRDVYASELPHFQQVYSEVSHMHDNSKTVLNPYFTDKSTGVGSREMWAEGYAAWLHGRQEYRTPDEQALLIGHELGAAPTEKLRVGRLLQRYFDIQDEKMRELVK